MSQQRIICAVCQRRIATVRRGRVGRTVRPTRDGEVISSDRRRVRVRCIHCRATIVIALY